MVRPVAPSALVVAAIAASGHASCIALLCYDDETCSEGTGGAGTTASSTVTTTDSGITSTSVGTTGVGGTGGGVDCGDILYDPQNCGACGHHCFSDKCLDGYCAPSSLDLAPNDPTVKIGPVHVRGATALLIAVADAACTTPGPACLQRVTVALDGVTELVSVTDTGGMWGRSPDRSYYTPQASKTIVTCTDDVCDTGTTVGGGGHFNGPAPTLGKLFVLEAATPNLLRFDLDAQGHPSGAPTTWLTMQTYGSDGPHMMFAKPGSENVYFTTYGAGGCLYLQNVASMPASPVPCLASLPTGNGPLALAVDPGGIPFVIGLLPGPVYWMPQNQLEQLGNITVRPPIAVDDRFIYTRSGADGIDDGLLVLDRTDGHQVLKLLEASIASVDASHQEFVFFTAGEPANPTSIYRWRKPPPQP